MVVFLPLPLVLSQRENLILRRVSDKLVYSLAGT